MKRFLLTFIIAMFISLYGNAQLVNIEKHRKSNTDKNWHGAIDFAIDIQENTKSIFQGKNMLELQYMQNAHKWLLLNELSLLKVDTSDLINNGFQHFRYNYTFCDSSFLTFETFAQHQYNTIKLLKRRVLFGLGTRFRIFQTNKINWYIATLLMYEYENMNDPENIEYTSIKGDFYTSFSCQFNNLFSINHVTYYQPHLKEFADFRLSSESALSIKISNLLAIKIIYNIAYDSQPPQEIPKLFYSLSNAISFRF